jgi:cell division inhibitor SepF
MRLQSQMLRQARKAGFMSAMRKIGEYLGLLEDTGRYDDEYDERYDDGYGSGYRQGDDRTEEHAVAVPAGRSRLREARGTVSDLSERRRPVVASSIELSRITTLHPRTYNEARTVGENFREGTPVIMNLSEMDDSDAKRLVDFAAGLVFATRGTIERITSKVFLLSPPNVTVAAEDKARLVETGGFFNQS